jgi:hypothetical protein
MVQFRTYSGVERFYTYSKERAGLASISSLERVH